MLTLTELDQAALVNRQVLVRADLNVPLDAQGGLLDTQRLEAVLPTLRLLLKAGAGVRVVTHLGRPNVGDCEPSTWVLGKPLESMLGQPVGWDPHWPDAVAVVPPGELVLTENVRFLAGETDNDARLSRRMARGVDVWVNDAFAVAHRVHASTFGVAAWVPCVCAGLLMHDEVAMLDSFLQHQGRRLAVVGGSKVSTKVGVLSSLMERVDVLAVGGAMANTFLVALGHKVGDSLWEEEALAQSQSLIAKAQSLGCQLLVPSEVVVGVCVDGAWKGVSKPVESIDSHERIVDVGAPFVDAVLVQANQATHVLWNGPLGWYEQPPFDQGSVRLARGLKQCKAQTCVGGGDTLALLPKADGPGQFQGVSTGGGAMLSYLERGGLPGCQVCG